MGKSCLSIQAVKHKFETNYSATVGFEFFSFNVKLNNEVVKLQIWDTEIVLWQLSFIQLLSN